MNKVSRKQIYLGMIIIFLSLFLLLLSFKTTILFTNFSPQQQNVVNYLNDKTELDGNYTEAERSHMEDVQKLFKKGNAFFLLLSGSFIFILSLFHERRKEITQVLRKTGITTTTIILLLLIITFISFTSSFTFFHTLFFPQGNWQFPADSLLIQTFPLELFTKMSSLILLQTLGWGILFILVSLYLTHADQKRQL